MVGYEITTLIVASKGTTSLIDASKKGLAGKQGQGELSNSKVHVSSAEYTPKYNINSPATRPVPESPKIWLACSKFLQTRLTNQTDFH